MANPRVTLACMKGQNQAARYLKHLPLWGEGMGHQTKHSNESKKKAKKRANGSTNKQLKLADVSGRRHLR